MLTRVGTAILVFPMPGLRNTPQMVRVVLSLAITLCLLPTWPPANAEESIGGMTLALIGESAFGLFLGLAVSFVAETLQLGAQLISMQTGFSFASTFDPTSQADSNIFQVLSQLLAGFLFFSFDIHHHFLRLLGLSLNLFDSSGGVLREMSVTALIRLGSKTFLTGLQLALPVIALLFIVDLCMATLSRLHSQLQLLSVAFPAKIALSFFFVATVLERWPSVYVTIARNALDSLFKSLSR